MVDYKDFDGRSSTLQPQSQLLLQRAEEIQARVRT